MTETERGRETETETERQRGVAEETEGKDLYVTVAFSR